jgi:hypothetical protein
VGARRRKAALGEIGVVGGAQPEADLSDEERAVRDAERVERDAQRRQSIEGQRHFGSAEFGDIRPPSDPKERLLADLDEVRDKRTATDFHGALVEGRELVREVLHRHGMIMADEVD